LFKLPKNISYYSLAVDYENYMLCIHHTLSLILTLQYILNFMNQGTELSVNLIGGHLLGKDILLLTSVTNIS